MTYGKLRVKFMAYTRGKFTKKRSGSLYIGRIQVIVTNIVAWVDEIDRNECIESWMND